MSKAKYSLGQKVNYIFKDGTPCEVTIVEVVSTHKGFYYEVVGWEGTSWGHVSEYNLQEVDERRG